MGLQQVKLGDTVKSVAIERYKGVEKVIDVVSILSRNIAAAAIHYHQNTSFFYCFKGACCAELGLPNIRYIVPIVRYTVTKFPLEYGLPVSLAYMALGKDTYEADIKVKDQITGDVTKIDLSINCTDAGYQKLKIDQMGASKWRSDEAMKKVVQELYREYVALIELSVARNLTPERMLELLAQEPRFPEKSKTQRTPPSHQIASSPVTPVATENLLDEAPIGQPSANLELLPDAKAGSKAVSGDDFSDVLAEPKKA